MKIREILCCLFCVTPLVCCETQIDSVQQRDDKFTEVATAYGYTPKQIESVLQNIHTGTVSIDSGYSIEKIPQTDMCVIRPLSHTKNVGHGTHKTVHTVLLYDGTPRVIVECVCDASAKQEIEMLERFRNVQGLVHLLGYKKTGQKYLMWMDYFAMGSLASVRDRHIILPESQVVRIAGELSYGLSVMHSQNVCHRDIHLGNILLQETAPNVFDAVLIDFGKALPIQDIGSLVPQGARRRNPPEAVIHRWMSLDRYAVDVYALGCNLFEMVWNTSVPWANFYNIHHVRKYSHGERQERYASIIDAYRTAKEQYIGSFKDSSSMTPYQEFQSLIFAMIDPEPKQRPTMVVVVHTIGAIQEKISSAPIEAPKE